MAWALSDHVHFCVAGGRIVFLDTERDRYFALPDRLGIAFLEWQGAGGRTPLPETLCLLEREKLLRGDASQARIRATERPIPRNEAPKTPDWRAAIDHCPTLLSSFFATRRNLRKGLQFALDRILPPPRPNAEPDGLLPAYLWMRDRLPLRPKCLFDSLALLDFLHGQNAAATIVFGVKARPFTAHCWVEHAGAVLNDTVDHVGTFTPILAR